MTSNPHSTRPTRSRRSRASAKAKLQAALRSGNSRRARRPGPPAPNGQLGAEETAGPELIEGRLSVTRAGNAFVRPHDRGIQDVFVAGKHVGAAIHDDDVAIRLLLGDRRSARAGDQPNGAVVRVVTRRRTHVVGTLVAKDAGLELCADDPLLPRSVRIRAPRRSAPSARAGDKVVVEQAFPRSRSTALQGRVVDVLGRDLGDPGVDMLAVRRQHDLPAAFPTAVLAEARAMDRALPADDLAGRRDLRESCVVTIDPEEARDLDDAFGLERTRTGWRLRIHVADVAHYVRPGSALDAEARRRGNSTYLVDGVVPMLPEELSNGLCSLHPGVDHLDEAGRVSRIDRVEHDESHQLIEELMLLANEAVASALMERSTPAVHRVHEEPEVERLARFRTAVLRAGVRCGRLERREEILDLLGRLEGLPAGAALRVAFLRAQNRARYSTKPLGHYGLAKGEYAHFTSPIRRYADLTVHRALLDAGAATGDLADLADHLSETERNSSAAERTSKLVKLLAFLEEERAGGRAGAFPGVIVDVSERNVVVEVPDLGLGGELRIPSPTKLGRRRRDRSAKDSQDPSMPSFRVGQQLPVELQGIDLPRQQARFRPAGSSATNAHRGRARRPRPSTMRAAHRS